MLKRCFICSDSMSQAMGDEFHFRLDNEMGVGVGDGDWLWNITRYS